MIRSYHFQDRAPEVRKADHPNNIVWPKRELLEIAHLLDRLCPPDFRHPELFHEQKSALSHELRRLAVRRVAHT